MHAQETAVGHKPRHDLSSVAAPDLGVLEFGPSQPRGGKQGVLSRQLDAQEVHAWPSVGRVDQEKPLARPDFQLDGIGIGEQLRPVNGRLPSQKAVPGRSGAGKRRWHVGNLA